jgi:hypothetical protein
MPPTMSTAGPENVDVPTRVSSEDDIDDPVTPMAIIADQVQALTEAATVTPTTLEGQMAMHVNIALFAFSQHAANVLGNIDKSWDAALRVLDTKNSVLHCLAETLQNFATVTPYSATIHAVTPSGFPTAFAVQHATYEGFDLALGRIFQFLKAEGFTPPQSSGA